MIQFIKDAVREFKHVVWPTRKETQKYFSLVLAMLVFFGIYLFIASNIFSEIIFGLKNILGPEVSPVNSSSLSQEEIDALFSDEVNIEETQIEDVTLDIDSADSETATGEVAQ